jgi:hypothetical protein
VTVPEKLPVACPWRAGETESAIVQTTNRESILNLMRNTPFDHPCLQQM